MVDRQIGELEARRQQIATELQRVEQQLRTLRTASCSRCGDSKTVAVSGGLYGAEPHRVPCPACT